LSKMMSASFSLDMVKSLCQGQQLETPHGHK